MGLLSNKICRDKLKEGDHIYSWRTAYVYSHHGIYVGNGEVIHFTRGGGLETGTGTLLDKIIVSSVPNHGDKVCLNCGDQSNLHGVIASCLDCFLAGDNLYLFEYGVSPALFMAKPRGGTCTTASSEFRDEVISRAEFLLLTNGFGAYNLLDNNCEDFAIYCKTGLVVSSKMKLGSSGQAHSASVARDAVYWSAQLLGTVKSCGKAASVVSSRLGYVFTRVAGIGGMSFGGVAFSGVAFLAYSKYNVDRLLSDIGMRSDVQKLHVERLVAIIYAMEDKLDYINKLD